VVEADLTVALSETTAVRWRLVGEADAPVVHPPDVNVVADPSVWCTAPSTTAIVSTARQTAMSDRRFSTGVISPRFKAMRAAGCRVSLRAVAGT
jgi:hypothetical protein